MLVQDSRRSMRPITNECEWRYLTLNSLLNLFYLCIEPEVATAFTKTVKSVPKETHIHAIRHGRNICHKFGLVTSIIGVLFKSLRQLRASRKTLTSYSFHNECLRHLRWGGCRRLWFHAPIISLFKDPWVRAYQHDKTLSGWTKL